MMTEIETIEGGQKDVSSLEGTTLKHILMLTLRNCIEQYTAKLVLTNLVQKYVMK